MFSKAVVYSLSVDMKGVREVSVFVYFLFIREVPSKGYPQT